MTATNVVVNEVEDLIKHLQDTVVKVLPDVKVKCSDNTEKKDWNKHHDLTFTRQRAGQVICAIRYYMDANHNKRVTYCSVNLREYDSVSRSFKTRNRVSISNDQTRTRLKTDVPVQVLAFLSSCVVRENTEERFKTCGFKADTCGPIEGDRNNSVQWSSVLHSAHVTGVAAIDKHGRVKSNMTLLDPDCANVWFKVNCYVIVNYKHDTLLYRPGNGPEDAQWSPLSSRGTSAVEKMFSTRNGVKVFIDLTTRDEQLLRCAVEVYVSGLSEKKT